MSTNPQAFPVDTAGAFVRRPSVFRSAIDPAGPFPPEGNRRYILYVSYACPWAHRTLIFRALKGLQDAIGVVVVEPVFGRTRPEDASDSHEGWLLPEGADPVYGARSIRDIYDKATPADMEPTPRFTVPILFDTKSRAIVNNESSEIIRFLNTQFNAFATRPELDLYPETHRAAIDSLNDTMYNTINNGVYRCGFAQSQEAYDAAIGPMFDLLDRFDVALQRQRFLVPGTTAPTEADIRLFVTLVRFDEVYVVHFKTNKKLIREYAALPLWMRDVYQWNNGAITDTVHFDHIKKHYYGSHRYINTYGIIPAGPGTAAELVLPHGREALQQ